MKEPMDGADSGLSVLDDMIHEAEIGDRRPSEAVVDVTAALLDNEPTDMTPLYRTLDPEALDRLCTNADPGASPTVTFNYEGFVVTVNAPNEITVFEP